MVLRLRPGSVHRSAQIPLSEIATHQYVLHPMETTTHHDAQQIPGKSTTLGHDD